MKRTYWSSGEPFIWATAVALCFILTMMFTLVGVIFVNGMGVFWPKPILLVNMNDGSKFLGEHIKTQESTANIGEQIQLKIGNRDLYHLDFIWLKTSEIKDRKEYPLNVVEIEREEYGNFIGFIKSVQTPEKIYDNDLMKVLADAKKLIEKKSLDLDDSQAEINRQNTKIAKLRYTLKKISYQEKTKGRSHNAETFGQGMLERNPNLEQLIKDLRANISLSQYLPNSAEVEGVLKEMIVANEVINDNHERIKNVKDELSLYVVHMVDVNGTPKQIDLSKTFRIFQPNQMGFFEKVSFYFSKIVEILFDDPREANTEGGLFPAIFGTVMMIILMSLLTFPMGVIAGIYLREYAKSGFFLRTVRIAVNNLAGIPSIVYGIFGVGFFIHFVGGGIDSFFFPELAGEPYFKKGGILWASLTLGLLTVPVVIVATEEALSSIPSDVRQASLAMGATKLQTLLKVLIPMASPGILTGFILAMSRAAGEVAPLMITGVVKIAPDLPFDGNWPFFHLDRSFMHLGFHIYDVGFQSPNVEAAKPMVYVTSLLLLLIVFCMSITAIWLRNSMKRKYAMKSF